MNDEAFLSTAAQVIPVWILVLSIEDRRLPATDRHSAAVHLLVLLSLAMGEFVALSVRPASDSLEIARAFMMCAIVLGLIALVGPLFRPALELLGRLAVLVGIVYMLVAVTLVALQVVQLAVAGFATMGVLVVLTYFYDPLYRRGFGGGANNPVEGHSGQMTDTNGPDDRG